MLKTCDSCNNAFDIFAEGMGKEFFVMCGKCWSIELHRRQIGGVFTEAGA